MNVRRPKPPRRPLFDRIFGFMMVDTIRIFGIPLDGRSVMTTLLFVVAIGGSAFWWLNNRDFYTETKADTVVIAGNEYPVTEFRGIEAAGDPDKMRACFRIRDPIFGPPAPTPRPTPPPGWFKCFYPDRIIEELARGRARIFLAEYNNPPGYDRIVVVYDSPREKDLRAFMWRQTNENYVE